jgi:hypothetical protein
MHTPQPIPNGIILFQSHPARGDKEVENEIHGQQNYHQIEDLNEMINTIVMETLSLRLTM